MFSELLVDVLGAEGALRVLDRVGVPGAVLEDEVPRDQVPRAAVAAALGLALVAGLLERVPTGAAYVEAQRGDGRRVAFDHGALRTVDWTHTGDLPSGVEAFRRILVPLGYEEVGEYPLDRIHMTGRVFCHADLPEDLPQYFVSELHVARLPEEAQAATTRVFGASTDSLADGTTALLDLLAEQGWLAPAEAATLVRALVLCFARQHADPALADYETLLTHSAELAWIATEGNAFNHATDRVADVEALAERLAAAGQPVKDAVERSRNGRVRQTAFRADAVLRLFVDEDGTTATRLVPGSFFEFISRDHTPEGPLDLTFDSGNAQGIFTMTRALPSL